METVSIVRSRARVRLPRLVVRARRAPIEGLLWLSLIVSLFAAVTYFRLLWLDAVAENQAIAAAWQAERENRTGVYVHLDEGVECKSPHHSDLWIEVVKGTCRALGISYRDLVINKRRR